VVLQGAIDKFKRWTGETAPSRGRRLGKSFLTLLQHWSGAVTCPAC